MSEKSDFAALQHAVTKYLEYAKAIANLDTLLAGAERKSIPGPQWNSLNESVISISDVGELPLSDGSDLLADLVSSWQSAGEAWIETDALEAGYPPTYKRSTIGDAMKNRAYLGQKEVSVGGYMTLVPVYKVPPKN